MSGAGSVVRREKGVEWWGLCCEKGVEWLGLCREKGVEWWGLCEKGEGLSGGGSVRR